MRHLLLLLVLLPSLAAAQIEPISQNRSVFCMAEAYNFDSGDGGTDQYFEEAENYGTFERSYSAEWIEELATAASEVSQASTILADNLEMSGNALATAQTSDEDWYGYGTAASDFGLEFEVEEGFRFRLTGNIATEGGGYIDVELRQDDGTLLFGIHESGSTAMEVDEFGDIPAGTYWIIASAYVDAYGGTAGVPVSGDAMFELEFVITTDPIGVGDTFSADRYLTAGPNPMQGSTQIAYASGRFAPVTLDVLDVRGRRVRELVTSAANAGQVIWDGRNDQGQPVPQGLYVLRMRSDKDVLLRKVSVVR